MADRSLGWGLLGTARINRSLIPPIRASSRNRLVAVASRDRARSEAYAREWNIERAFESYATMLDSSEIDVVYISLPNSLHAEWTVKAVQAGKHVLCEKPLATSVAAVDAIIEAAHAAGVVVAEAFMYRHHPQTLKIEAMIDSGAIGEVKLVRGSFTFTISQPGDVRLNASLAGGSVWDVGCYPISYARTMIGAEPLEVMGLQTVGASGVDETFVGQMCFSNSAYAQFDSGFRAPFRTHIEIVGSEGLIVVPSPFKPKQEETFYIGTAGDQLEPVKVKGFEHLYSGEVEDMADAILLGKPARISLHDSRNNVAAIVALLKSAKDNKPIPIV